MELEVEEYGRFGCGLGDAADASAAVGAEELESELDPQPRLRSELRRQSLRRGQVRRVHCSEDGRRRRHRRRASLFCRV